MIDHDVLGDVNLLEWSHELDRALLRLPFKPLQPTTDDGRALFLYKLAYSSKRKEAGLILLDCDACTAFYEGVSLRTLNRRTQMSTASNGSDDTHHLRHIVDAIHHALNPQTVLDTSLRTTIGLESTRFSSSLSINLRSRHDDAEKNFKTSFDLDPLDHASLSNLLSSHFVRPLLSLASVLAQSASHGQLDSLQKVEADLSKQQSISSDSMELLRRSALSHAGLPVKPLIPLVNGSAAQRALEREAQPSSAMSKPDPASDVNPASSAFDFAAVDDDLGDQDDLLLFGPPGCRLPPSSQSIRKSSKDLKQEARSSSPVHRLSSDNDNDGDVTLTAPPAKAEGRISSDDYSPQKRVSTRNKDEIVDTHASDDELDSTSEEESLPMHVASDAEVVPKPATSRSNKAASSMTNAPNDASASTQHMNGPQPTKLASQLPSKRMPYVTTPPPPSTFTLSASQVTPSTRDAEREEQRRRREEIARIKRGPSTQSTQGSTTSKASVGASSARKRSRF